MSPHRIAIVVLLSCSGCGAPKAASFGPNSVEIPVSDGARPDSRGSAATSRQSPPASGAAKESPFPAVSYTKLGNGLGVDVVTSHALPVVQLRVLVRAGTGYGALPAVAALTGGLLKDGGTRAMSSANLLRRIETLGADLAIKTEHDSTVISMAVTKEQLAEGVSLLAQIVREPRFDNDELRKLKARTTDEVEGLARSSGNWTATHVIFRELYAEKSVYRTAGLLPSEIAKVDAAAVREHHRRFFVPKTTTLVLAGDVDEATAKGLAEKTFGSWTGGDVPKVNLAPPRLPAKTRVFIAHRPKSSQSDVFVAGIAPARKAQGWASMRVATDILGGGVGSRLFADVREQRGLAYRTTARIEGLAHGEQPFVVHAGTETAKTAQALTGLLENVARMTTSPPTPAETDRSRRFLDDIFAIRMETIGSIADLVVVEEELGLGPGYWDAFRKELRTTDAAATGIAAQKLCGAGEQRLIVVAGDADVIAPELAKFGEVTVVDPEKEFKIMRTVPKVSP